MTKMCLFKVKGNDADTNPYLEVYTISANIPLFLPMLSLYDAIKASHWIGGNRKCS